MNNLEDKEVEQVVMKNFEADPKNPIAGVAGGYELPDDDDDGAGIGVPLEDDEEREQEEEGDMEGEEGDGNDGEPDDDDYEEIEDQIVNITSKNGRGQQPEQPEQPEIEGMNDEAILVINNQNNLEEKDRPQTKQVKHRQAATAQGSRPNQADNHQRYQQQYAN